MNVTLNRFAEGDNTTAGRLFLGQDFLCYTLEDSVRTEKIPTKTAIWKGVYELSFLEQLTPLTVRYRERFDFFFWHLWVKNTIEFENVYIHVGNNHTDSAGCILVGESVIYDHNDYHLTQSSKAYERAYKKLSPIIREERVSLAIE